MNKVRYKWIDALRGYGALSVLMCHLIQRLQFENMIGSNGFISYFLNGARAVQMFFIISGMMAFLTLSHIDGGGESYFSYVKRKYMRLFPIYILMICIYYNIGNGYAINSFSDNATKITLFGIVLNLLGLHGFSPIYINTVVPGGWYVGIIWIYFLIAPLLTKLIRNTSAAVKCMFFGLVLRVIFHMISNYYIEDIQIKEWADMFILNQFLFLAIGQLLFFILIKKDLIIRKLDQVFLVFSLLYITFQVDTLVLWGLIFIVVIVLLSKSKDSIFVNRLALLIGKYSYEIYLCHIAVIYYICKISLFKFDNAYTTILVTFIICTVLTSLIAATINKLIGSIQIRFWDFLRRSDECE